MPTVCEIAALLEGHYPLALAEDWDRVGLAVGSRSSAVDTVLLTVDCTLEVVADARAVEAQLIIAHHPAFLRGLGSVDLDTPKGALAGALISSGIGLYVAHTNADVPPGGVVDALARRLGLQQTRPMLSAPAPALDKIVTFVPTADAAGVVDALAAAGAGAVGAYDRCAFTSTGLGTFRPLAGAQPYVGRVGEMSEVAETRIEMVLSRSVRAGVVAALRSAHPYETPAWDLLELAELPSEEIGLGRIRVLPESLSLQEFARQVTDRLPATGAGVRVSGDPRRTIRTVAVQAGAGDDLLDRARELGADVYLTSDLRHHPAMEASAWPGAPALIDVPHWAAEWTWLPVLQEILTADWGDRLRVEVSSRCTDPWTWHH